MQLDWLKDKEIIQWGGNALYFMLIFVIVLDPTNTVLHLKDVFFVLLVGYNCVFYKPDFSYLPLILLVYAMVLAGTVFGDMQGCRVDKELYSGTLKGFAPLVLLLWTPYYNVVRLSKWPIIIAGFFIAVLYMASCLSEAFEMFLFLFSKSHNGMIMMTHRNFLGFPIFGMYYKSMICFIFILFLVYHRLYNVRKHRFGYALAAIGLTFTFLVSGTRATMLLPLFMAGFVLYRTMQKWSRLRYFLYPLLAVGASAFLLLVFLLATQEGEASNAIKYAHLTSYIELFETHPEYLLLGQGPGAIFYSSGFKMWTAITEWTYIEQLRYYGIFSVALFFVLLNPIYKLLKYRGYEVPFGILGAYVAYLFIAGTNPLLVSSTGMVVLLSIYSYVYRIEKLGEYDGL